MRASFLNFGGSLFYRGEESYFKSLEKFALPFRQSARDMIDFIEQAQAETPELLSFKNTYQQIESCPIQTIYKGIEDITHKWTKANFSFQGTVKNQTNLKNFFELQNHFGNELNRLLNHAMRVKP